ncbi:hypothetical protein [Moraxella lacunata]|uniref:hypothetical protein n=1 Tax=Moraxella lacunata TaxID=477 RepID=UPI003EE32F7D
MIWLSSPVAMMWSNSAKMSFLVLGAGWVMGVPCLVDFGWIGVFGYDKRYHG